MKAYVARDWTGVHLFKTEPRLEKCGGCGEVWCGYKMKQVETPELLEQFKDMSCKKPQEINLEIIVK